MEDNNAWRSGNQSDLHQSPSSPDTYSGTGDGEVIEEDEIDDIDDDDDEHHHHRPHHHHSSRRQPPRRSPPQARKHWRMDRGSDDSEDEALGGKDSDSVSLFAEMQQMGAWRGDDPKAWSEEVKPTERAELKRKGSWLDEDGGAWLGEKALATDRSDLKRSKEVWFSEDSLEKDDSDDDDDDSNLGARSVAANKIDDHSAANNFFGGEEAGLTAEEAEQGAEDDVYQLLVQKEQDLVLAAELGKALLEKNQELEQQLATLTEEFTHKVEVLEQERYVLQSQLTQRQAEFDNTVRDLQEDINQLTEQLRQHDDLTSEGQRRHVSDLRQLQQFNEQLSEHLRKSLAQQQVLTAEVGQLREQLTSRRNNQHQRYDHVDQLEDELQCLRQRHQELEVQIRRVKEERDALTAELESLQERLLLLEKQRLQQDEQLHHQHTEILELRDSNSALQSQLEVVTSRLHASGDSPTLFAELSHLTEHNDSGGNSASVIQFHNGDRVACLSADMIEEDDFEYDDDIFGDVMTHSSPVPPDLGYHGNTSGNSLQDELFGQWPEPSQSAPVQLCEGGKVGEGDGREGATTSPSRRYVTLTAELQDILKDMYSDTEETDIDSPAPLQAITYESPTDDVRRGDDVCNLDKQTQGYFDDMMQAQQNRIERLEKRVQELESRVQELQEERDRLQDARMGDVSGSHVLHVTRSERDRAFEKVMEVEKELSRLTDDVVTLNYQLMATIKKKVMISQELDQWQVDLSEALAVQVEKRMREHQNAEKAFTVFKKQNLQS